MSTLFNSVLQDRLYIGLRIKEERERMGLSQEKLGRMIGVKSQSISHYENGKRDIPVSQLLALSRALQVPMDFMLPQLSVEFQEDLISFNDALLALQKIPQSPTTINDALQKVKAARRQLEEAEEQLEGLLMFSAATSPTQEPESTVDVNPELFDRERKKQRKKKNA